MGDKSRFPLAIVGLVLLACVVAGLVWLRGAGDDEAADVVAEPANMKHEAGERAKPRARRGESSQVLRGAGKAVVSGTIRDEGGAGIGGANVCAFPEEDELMGAGDGLPRCVLSEHDGHYRLEGLWPVTTMVSASAAGHEPQRWVDEVDDDETRLRLRAGQERRGVDITLASGGVAVRGVVKDIAGGVIEDAIVRTSSWWWFGGGEGVSVAWTDAEGRFELWVAADGDVSLYAEAEGYAEASTQVAAPTDIAELYLTPESVISGTVVHAETKQPLAGITVTLGGDFFSDGGGSALSDDEGGFRISGVAPGIYDIDLRGDEFYGEGVEKVHLGLAQSIEGLVVEAHPAFYVSGTVLVAGTDTLCTKGRVSLKDADEKRVSAATDDEGHVLLRGLLPGSYEVTVFCDDYVSADAYDDIVIAEASLDDVTWEVRPGRAIRGIVVDSAGQPVAKANVSARAKLDADDPRAQQTSAWGAETKDDGEFELGGLLAGSYELSVWSETLPRLEEVTEVEVGGADVEGVRIEMPASGSMIGLVRDEQGEPVANVEVEASHSEGRWSSRRVRSGDDGRFELTGLALGSTRVTAQRSWSEALRAPGTTDDDLQGQLVEVVAEAPVEVELEVESHGAVISGRVVDSTGAPVSDAFVDASRMSDRAGANAGRSRGQLRWGWDRKPVLSDQDGGFELRELAEGSYIVRAYRKGGGEAIIEGVATGSANVELAIVDTGEISGQVVLAGGGSPERFEITAIDREQGLWRNDDFFRTQGSFALRELPPGSYEVTVTAKEGSAKSEVSVGVGEASANVLIELTPKVTVRGRLVDAQSGEPVSGMKVSVRARGGGMSFSLDSGKAGEEVSGSDGRFVVEDADAGKVSLTVMPRNWSDDVLYTWTNRSLELPAEPATQDLGDIELFAKRIGPKERPGDLGITFEESAPGTEPEDRRFVVALVRPGGPAEGSGLEVGDVIVEVDGQSVSGLDSHRFGPLTRAPAGTALTLTTEAGASVKIVLGPSRE